MRQHRMYFDGIHVNFGDVMLVVRKLSDLCLMRSVWCHMADRHVTGIGCHCLWMTVHRLRMNRGAIRALRLLQSILASQLRVVKAACIAKSPCPIWSSSPFWSFRSITTVTPSRRGCALYTISIKIL